jgi:hypothetical protein
MHNERVRLFAQAVSTFGIGSLLAGVITPFATTHTGSTDFWGWLVAGLEALLLGQIWLGLWREDA